MLKMETLPTLRRSFELEGRNKKLYISNQELISHGCISCIWRINKQCPHAIQTETEFYEFTEADTKYSGYCPEYVDFLLSFAGENDSTSAIWEKFSLYVGRMQSLDDYKEYKKLEEEITLAERNGDNGKADHLTTKKDLLRLYWERLNDNVRKGYSRAVDREYRLKENRSNVPGIMNAKVINFNMGNKELEKKEE